LETAVLVMTAILLPPNLRQCPEFGGKHDPPNCSGIWVLEKTSEQFRQPEGISHFVVIDPRRYLTARSLERAISSKRDSNAWFNYIVDGDLPRREGCDYLPSLVADGCVVDNEDREPRVGLDSQTLQASREGSGPFPRAYDHSELWSLVE
jgi:hypothetical protein